MLSVERKEKIREAMFLHHTMSVTELASLLNVSMETVRRDLNNLEREGFLTKTHGGATLQRRVAHSASKRELSSVLVENKRRMCIEAAKLVRSNDCLYLDNSTTVYELCQFIAHLPLTVVTHSLSVLNAFADNDNVRLISTGGDYRKRDNAFMGMETVSFLESHSFDKSFISCRSISLDRGLSDSDDMSAEIRKKIISSSTVPIILADHTKLGRAAYATICDLSEIKYLITDGTFSEDWKSRLDELSIFSIECKMEVVPCKA